MKISYNWLKWYIPEVPEPEKLWDVFTFHLCEVESMDKLPDGNTIFDINILPNRAHDLLSHQGVAQELSALLDIEYKSPVELYRIPESKQSSLEIKIDSNKCRRYMGRIVRNIKVGPSPDWVVKHLESIGQRSINNIVDATNIVMFDCGNPTHIFDAKKVGTVIKISNAKNGNKIKILGGEEKELSEQDLVIADASGIALAIAGVKGGTYAEVDENTTEIILEVANFDPVSVRKTAKRTGIQTDATKRFENDLSPVRAEYAMRELSATILEMCPEAQFEDIVDVFPGRAKWETPHTIEINSKYINEKLGSNFSDIEIENVWKRMKFEYSKSEEDFTITVPLLRLDLTGRHDLVEEVGRVIGYDKVKPELPQIDFKHKVNETFYKILSAKKKLVEDGYREVMTYSFTKKGEVYVTYGAKGKEALRTNLTDGIKVSYEMNKLNAPLLGDSEIKIFEIGNVYPKTGVEETHVACADKKEVTEVTLDEFTKGIEIGNSYDELLTTFNSQLITARFAPWSVFPFITRDISIWVPQEVESEKVCRVIKEYAGDLVVVGPTLFDEFEKDGRKSLAFRLVFQSQDRTLTDNEVSHAMEPILVAVKKDGWGIR